MEGTTISPADVSAAGLDYAMDGRGFLPRNISAGPGGGAGIILAFDRHDGQIPAVRYAADAQTWRKGPAGKFWVGVDNDDHPGPDDLIRRSPADGERIKLLDDNEWIIPRIVSPLRANALHKLITLDDDGETWLYVPMPEDEAIIADGNKVLDLAKNCNGGNIRIDFQEGTRIAISALKMNYRIGPLEVDLLHLLSESDIGKVLWSMIDGAMIDKFIDRQLEDARPAKEVRGGE